MYIDWLEKFIIILHCYSAKRKKLLTGEGFKLAALGLHWSDGVGQSSHRERYALT